MASAMVPLPLALRNFTPINWVIQFTPTTPMPLPAAAPMVPATCVPWLWSSMGSQVSAMALKPCEPAGQVIETPPTVTENGAGADQRLPARSGCV